MNSALEEMRTIRKDREEDSGRDAGKGGFALTSLRSDRFPPNFDRPEPEFGVHELIIALERTMDSLPAELVLCSTAGTILYANPHAQKRLGTGEDRKDLEEEIRFLCVALHLEIAERVEQEEEEIVPRAERRVRLNGSEMHLRAVDLGIRRHGRSPTILIMLDPQNPLSDQALEQLGLTRAEIRVARLVMEGKTNREIAQSLTVSVHTVRHHVQHLLDKLGVRSRTQLTEAICMDHRNRIVAA